MTYPGGKNGAGVYQTIINHIPPHDTYVEPFAGGAAIFQCKKLAWVSYLIEKDEKAAKDLLRLHKADLGTTVSHECGLEFLKYYFYGPYASAYKNANTFIYADPPYVMDSRKSQRPIYNHEWTEEDHIEFLKLVNELPCSIAISGYASALYDEYLKDWKVITFTAQTRQGPATEYLWMNYPEPTALHDCSYLGQNFRERERIKRKAARWATNFKNMDALERQAVLSAMIDAAGSCTTFFDEGGFDYRQTERYQLTWDPIALSDDVGQHLDLSTNKAIPADTTKTSEASA